MARFRKKPVVVEAEQYIAGSSTVPDGVVFDNSAMPLPYISTLEGPMAVIDGDWIITGVKGERYPCRPDIFALTYDPERAVTQSYSDYPFCGYPEGSQIQHQCNPLTGSIS